MDIFFKFKKRHQAYPLCAGIELGEKCEDKDKEKGKQKTSKEIKKRKGSRYNPEDAPLCYARAMALLKEKQIGAAIYYLTEAVNADRTYAKAYKERGKLYRSQGNLHLARDDYNMVLTLDEEDSFIYILRGVTFEDEGLLDLAISDFTSAVLTKPDDKLAYLHRGRSFFLARRYAEAIQDYNRVLLLNPKDAVAFRNRGLTYRHQGNLNSAINDLNKSIELDPKNATAYLNRSVILFMRGRSKDLGNLFANEAAIADFNKSIQLDSQTCIKALQSTSKLIKTFPKDFYHYVIRGVLYHLNGNHQAAVEDHLKALSLNPNLFETHTKLTCCLNKTTDDEAETKNYVDNFWFYNNDNPQDATTTTNLNSNSSPSASLTASYQSPLNPTSDLGVCEMNLMRLKMLELRRKSRFSVPFS